MPLSHLSFAPCVPCRGSLYSVPLVSTAVRHRSPPGTRKALPAPAPPSVPADLYHVLPRYHTYSDQLPDRFLRPLTAPDLPQPATAIAMPMSPCSPKVVLSQQASSPRPEQGVSQVSPSQDVQAGALPILPAPWTHRPPRLSSAQLELVLPPKRRGTGSGAAAVRSACCSPKALVSPCPSPFLQRQEELLPQHGQGPSQLTRSSSSLQVQQPEGPAWASVNGSSQPASLGGSLAVSSADWPKLRMLPQRATSLLQQSMPLDSWSEGGVLLGPCQADMAARHQMWGRVGRGSPKSPIPSPSTAAGSNRALMPSRSLSNSPMPGAVVSQLQLQEAGLRGETASAAEVEGTPALHHHCHDDVSKPWTPATGYQVKPWTPPMPVSTGSTRPRSKSQPRTRVDAGALWMQPPAALQFIQRVSPGLPRFYWYREPPSGESAM